MPLINYWKIWYVYCDSFPLSKYFTVPMLLDIIQLLVVIMDLFNYVFIITVQISLGPVRGVDFHPNQPLFVSGGDDYKIKVYICVYDSLCMLYVYVLQICCGYCLYVYC